VETWKRKKAPQKGVDGEKKTKLRLTVLGRHWQRGSQKNTKRSRSRLEKSAAIELANSQPGNQKKGNGEIKTFELKDQMTAR